MKCDAVLVFVFVASINFAHCYNVLFMLPFGSKSHKNVFDPVVEELAKRGHNVTMFSPINENKETPRIRHVLAKKWLEVSEKHDFSFFQGAMNDFSALAKMFAMVYDMIENSFQESFIADIVKQPRDPVTHKPKFDVVILDAVFNDFALSLGHHMGVPTVIFSPSIAFHHHSWNLNVPTPLSYVPSSFADYPEPMNFHYRAVNTISQMFFLGLLNLYLLPNMDAIIQKYIPNSPPLVELNRNVSFMLTNTHPAIHARKPGMPYTAEVGGLNCKPAKPLPKDLEDFMKSAGKDGVIYFSLGSVTKGESMPLEMRDKIVETFSKLPQTFIWKYEKDIPSLPSNIKLVKWAPQQDLLAHPQMRLFITHGGGLSLFEAAYHGTPLLAFPLSADQHGNAVNAKRLGVGDYLDWKTFTSQQLLNVIQKIINDPSYKEKSKKASILLQDRPQKPVETAAYWIEYVIRHNGAHFLKTSASQLNFFQYFLVDVLATSIAVLVLVIAIIYLIIKFTFKVLRGICSALGFCKTSPPTKSKSKKKTN